VHKTRDDYQREEKRLSHSPLDPMTLVSTASHVNIYAMFAKQDGEREVTLFMPFSYYVVVVKRKSIDYDIKC